MRYLMKKDISDQAIKDDSEMPTVSRFDPTSIVLGLRPSQIVELERPSRTSIKSKFYRICSH